MQELFEKHKKGIIGTTIFHVVILLIIIFLGFSTPLPLPEEEGIIINFGTDDFGLGFTQPARQEASAPAPTPRPQTETQAEEEIITQDIEEAPSLPTPEREEVTQPEQDRPVEQPQPDPVEEEIVPRETEEDAPERRPNPDALFPGRTATGDTGSSEGETTGEANQGRETGSVDSPHRAGGDDGSPDGISYSLAGRNFLKLPLPDYNRPVDGVIVVEVTVNRNGDVTNAIPGVRGSTTLNEYLLSTAKRAAENAKFNVRPDAAPFQKGTITYHFKQE